MKKFLLFFLLVIQGCFFSSSLHFSDDDIPKDAKTMILNGDFEQGKQTEDNPMPLDWLVLNESKKNNILWSNSSGIASSKALRISVSDSNVSIVSDAFDIDSNSAYFARCFIRASKNTSTPITLTFIAFDEQGERVNYFREKRNVKSEWKKINVSAGFFRNSAKFARLVITVPKNDHQVFIDNVDCYKVHIFNKF